MHEFSLMRVLLWRFVTICLTKILCCSRHIVLLSFCYSKSSDDSIVSLLSSLLYRHRWYDLLRQWWACYRPTSICPWTSLQLKFSGSISEFWYMLPGRQSWTCPIHNMPWPILLIWINYHDDISEGNVFLRGGDVDLAIECYDKALELGDREQEGVLLVMRGSALLQRAYACRYQVKQPSLCTWFIKCLDRSFNMEPHRNIMLRVPDILFWRWPHFFDYY